LLARVTDDSRVTLDARVTFDGLSTVPTRRMG
jgi:hypothetical protein